MKAAKFQSDLLKWYDVHARDLPWRIKPRTKPDATANTKPQARPHGMPDPYAVWLSEIMLQQTTVATVKAYFTAFTHRWPTVQALASAPLDDILAAWAGLGYYSRARNLHACAQLIAEQRQGVFPSEVADLLTLPGVGPYTAAAISAIAFGRPAVVIDGNIDRVMTRLHASHVPIKTNKAAIRDWAGALTPQDRPGDYAQALMDLGATLCRPTTPQCPLCPVKDHCAAHKQDSAAALPIKAPKPERPTRVGHAYLIQNQAGHVLIDKRPARGLLGGMDGLPTSDWQADAPPPLPASTPLNLEVRHTFTHFHLRLHLHRASADQAGQFPNARFISDFSNLALPTLFQKALKAANHCL